MRPITVFLSCLFTWSLFGQDLNTALKFLNSEQYEESEKVFEDLLARDPANGDLYYYYGETLLRDYLSDTFSNSIDEFANKAEQLFQKGIQQAPDNVLNQVGMGAVTLMMTSDTTSCPPIRNKFRTTLIIRFSRSYMPAKVSSTQATNKSKPPTKLMCCGAIVISGSAGSSSICSG